MLDEVSELSEDRETIVKLIAGGLRRDMQRDEAHREVRIPPVEPDEPLHAERTLEPRDARHEEELPQQEVCPDEAGEPTDGVEPVRGRLDRHLSARRPPKTERHPETDKEHDDHPGLARP